MSECIIDNMNDVSEKGIGWLLNYTSLIRNSDELKRITGKWIQFKNALFSDPGNKYAYGDMQDAAYSQFRKLNENQQIELVDHIRLQARNTFKDSAILDVSEITPIADSLRVKGYNKDLVSSVMWMESMLNQRLGKESYKIWETMSKKRGVADIYDNILSWKYAFLIEPDVMPATLEKYMKDKLVEAGVTSSGELKRALSNFMAEPLAEGWAMKQIGALKQLYTNIKYGIYNIPAGLLMLTNNLVMGNLLLMSRKRGLENIINNKLVDKLANEYAFLAGEDRVLANVSSQVDMSGKNRYFKSIDRLVNKIPLMGRRGKAIANSILQGGLHNGADLILQNNVKRTAIAQALAYNGINAMNIDKLFDLINKGKLSQERLDKLSMDATLYYHDFFSNSNNTTLNRHRFSKYWMFTTLQGYVLNRTAGIYNGLKQFSNAWKEGKIRTRGNFVDHINTTNQELKGFLNNTLLAAKMSIYTDIVMNAHEYETDEKSPYRYMLGMADYLSSLKSTFWYNILTSPLKGLDKYYEYTAATGKEEEVIDGIQVAALNMLSQTVRMFFREGNIVSTMFDAGLAFAKTGDLDFAQEVAGTSFEKISDGLGRYMLLPGVDTYGQKPIAEDDDVIGRLFMTLDKTNYSIGQSKKIQSMANIDSMLEDKGGFILRTLQYMPIIKSFVESSKSTGRNEARYKHLQGMLDSDEVLQQIWKGELPRGLLDANDDITKSLYNDLLSFDYSYKDYKGEGEHKVSERDGLYGMSQMEETVFVDNIANKVFGSREAMDKVLLSGDADRKNILKILAASEADTPGSSRIILSYLAKKDYETAKTAVYGSKYVSSADMDDEVELGLKKEILLKRYPYLYISDRTSQYKAVREYLNYARPDIYAGIQNDNDLKQLVNTMAWTDMMVMLEGDKGDVDANYIKNIFNTAAKYVQNTDDRINLVNHTMGVISGMKSPSNNIKQLMKVGVLGANIDFYDSLKMDDTTRALYGDDINRFENLVWGVIKNVNMAGNDLAMGELSGPAKRQYYGATGSSYSKPQYSNSNRKALDNFMNRANNKFPVPIYQQKPKQVFTRPSEIGNLKPKWYDIYVNIYDKEYRAATEDITKQRPREYPSDVIEGLKFSIKTKSPKSVKRAGGVSIKRAKRKSTSKSTKSDLPGGTNDISAD